MLDQDGVGAHLTGPRSHNQTAGTTANDTNIGLYRFRHRRTTTRMLRAGGTLIDSAGLKP
jgi:hypothetical protein